MVSRDVFKLSLECFGVVCYSIFHEVCDPQTAPTGRFDQTATTGCVPVVVTFSERVRKQRRAEGRRKWRAASARKGAGIFLLTLKLNHLS